MQVVSADVLALACGYRMTYLKRGVCMCMQRHVVGDMVVLVSVNTGGWVVVLVSVDVDG